MLTLVPNPERLDGEAFCRLLRFVPENVRQRASAIKSRDEKARSLISWMALIHTVRKEYGAVPNELDAAYDKYSKPYFAGFPHVHFSLSHCAGLSACVTDRSEIGLDAENIRPVDMRTAGRFCSPGELMIIRASREPERDFFRFWTLKESCIKAFGSQPCPIGRIEFNFDSGHPECSVKNTYFELFEEMDGFIIASCRLADTE
jgi:4'-phosphopantetheinyl transferase